MGDIKGFQNSKLESSRIVVNYVFSLLRCYLPTMENDRVLEKKDILVHEAKLKHN